MRRTDAPSRTAGFAATATTLLALVAVAAGVPALRAPSAHRAPQTAVACALSDAEAVRVMAAVVVAAARDLFAPATDAAVAPVDASMPLRTTAPVVLRPATADPAPAWRQIDLRRHDLPPPTC